jgi:LemA protein
MSTSIILLILLVVLVVYVVMMYNRLVRLREEFKNAFTQIDIQIKRRYELIPNLVEVAKGYLKHEKETLEAVIKARNQAASYREQAAQQQTPQNLNQLASADNLLTQGLGKLMLLTEAYPELKADQQMRELSQEIESTESRITFARQAYNDSVMGYNTYLGSFPSNVIGGMFGFGQASLLNAITDDAERAPVKVSF